MLSVRAWFLLRNLYLSSAVLSAMQLVSVWLIAFLCNKCLSSYWLLLSSRLFLNLFIVALQSIAKKFYLLHGNILSARKVMQICSRETKLASVWNEVKLVTETLLHLISSQRGFSFRNHQHTGFCRHTKWQRIVLRALSSWRWELFRSEFNLSASCWVIWSFRYVIRHRVVFVMAGKFCGI